MHGRRRNERGDATTEVVFVAPVLILLVSIVISFALWFHASQIARSASQEGVRAAKLPGGSTAIAEETTNRMIEQLGRSAIDAPVVVAERDERLTRVEVRGKAMTAVPGLSLPVHAKASAATESFRAVQ
jgi:hypothetical protein